MNKSLKTIQTVAASIPIIMCSDAVVQAQNMANVRVSKNSADLLLAKVDSERASLDTVQSQTDSNSQPQEILAPKSDSYLPDRPQKVQIEATQAISLKQAIALAIQNNKQLQEARLNVQRSEQQLQEAKAARYPVLNADVGIAQTDSARAEISSEITRQQNEQLQQNPELQQLQQGNEDLDDNSVDRTFNGNLNLSYDLYTGGGRGARIQQAEKEVEVAQLDLERIDFETRFEVSRDYYSLQNADSQVNIEQAAVQEARETLKDARLLKQAGSGTKFDVIRAEVELANAQQRLATAQSQQNTARRQLVATLDIGQQVELQTADEIEPAGDWQFSLEETIVMAYGNRSELQQLRLQKEINEKGKQIALAAVRPQVSLVAGYNLLEVHDDGVGINDGYNVGANVEWNIFDGGAAKSRARQSETDAEISEVQFADRRNEVRLEVERGYYALTANQENIDTSNKALELAEESLELARFRFQAGVGTQTDVIQAQSELTNARANYLSSIVDYNQSLNQLERAVAVLPDRQQQTQ